MATTKKRKTDAAEATEKVEHGCVQCGQIGEINARLDGQESTDLRIESAVQQLVANFAAEQKANNKTFTELKCEVTRLGTALENSNENSKQLIENQTEMLKQMKDLTVMTASVKQSQDDTKDMFEKHIHESDAWRANIERRLNKLERVKWFWYTLATVAAGVAGVASYLAAVYDVFKK